MSCDEDHLFSAIKRNDWEKARIILNQERVHRLVEYTNNYGENALHEACCHEVPVDILQSLLAASAVASMTQDENGETPLHSAIKYSYDNEIMMMVGAFPLAASVSDNQGWTPLHQSLYPFNKSMAIVKRILVAYPPAVMATDIYGDTPLHIFFWKWNWGLRNAIKTIKNQENSIADLDVENEGEIKEKMLKIHDTTIFLLQAAVRDIIEDPPISFQALNEAIKLKLCPWAFVSMIIKTHPEHVWEEDENGNFPLHNACVTESSSDGYLYKCFKCKSQLNSGSWYQYKLCCDWNYCQECFFKKGTCERNYFVMNPVDKIPAVIEDLIFASPKIASMPNRDGRLPLNLAIEQGKSYEGGGAKTIFHADPRALSTMDIEMHMYSFMLAGIDHHVNAKEKEGHLSDEYLEQFTSVFTLLMKNPVLVSIGKLTRENM